MVQMALVAPPTPQPPSATCEASSPNIGGAATANNAFHNLDSQPPRTPALLAQQADQRASASAHHVLSEAVKPTPTLTPAQLALLSHSLPPDERCWLIEGLCRALRDANERIAHDHTLTLMLSKVHESAKTSEELEALKATHAALVKEVGAARARNLEEVAARTYPSLGHGARRKLMGLDAGANGGSGSPSGGDASSSSGVLPAPHVPSGFFDPWRGGTSTPAPASSYYVFAAPLPEDPKSAGGRRSGDAGAGSPAGASGHGLYASGVAMGGVSASRGAPVSAEAQRAFSSSMMVDAHVAAAAAACGACDGIPSAACGQSHGAVGTAMGGGGLQMSRSMPALGGGAPPPPSTPEMHYGSMASLPDPRSRPRTTGLPGQVAARPVSERVRRHLAPPFLLQKPSLIPGLDTGIIPGPNGIPKGSGKGGKASTATSGGGRSGAGVSRLYAPVVTADGQRSSTCTSNSYYAGGCGGDGLSTSATAPSLGMSTTHYGGASASRGGGPRQSVPLESAYGYGAGGATFGSGSCNIPPARPNSRERAPASGPEDKQRQGACIHATSVSTSMQDGLLEVARPSTLGIKKQEASFKHGIGPAKG